MSLIAGVSGARRNAAVALVLDGRVVGVCELQRITRTRRTGLTSGRVPEEAIGAAKA